MNAPDAKANAEVPERIAELGGLRKGAAKEVTGLTGVPEATVYGVGSFFHLLAEPDVKVRVCQSLTCWMAGSGDLLEKAKAAGLPAAGCSCLAACDRPVAVLRDRRTLPGVSPEDIARTRGDWQALRTAGDSEATGWRGHVGPDEADPEKLAFDLTGDPDWSGHAFARALELGPEAVIGRIETAGLQGRGGAGFPAAIKWKGVRAQPETIRYVVLNADEGEPGTFKDREVLLRRPDRVLEGLAIAAQAVDAEDVYCYLRGEFESVLEVLREAIATVERAGVFPGIRFHVHIGHGAYICGEETALLEALEGKRGMPRLKPPFPTENGLWGKPTLIHNVETIACVPPIVQRGGDWFKELGKTGPGTKLYCVSGHVQRPGVYELPLGVSLDELVEVAGGYVGTLQAFSPGGASSGFLPPSQRSVPLDFKSLGEIGSMLGSAGVVVLNETVELARAVRQQLAFFEVESCGQCAPCRIGTRFQREAVDRFLAGRESRESSHELRHVAEAAWEMNEGSICGLGQAASLPLTSVLKWFPREFAI